MVATVGRARAPIYFRFSFVQAAVKRQSCRPGNGIRYDFLIATIK